MVCASDDASGAMDAFVGVMIMVGMSIVVDGKTRIMMWRKR